ncbi:putative polysaccharide biosynthesis protein [Alteribacter natronophilus]|uniref:putative polysaccharide biosynthesis protein n=1 Tax=Alteribacter natronophilus TaxID=2583810 RepID=UPI00110E63DA|nr:polysaccharide biosynthesis protein [Alteribacter natronophilus]TMW71789.1 polysaccharide biosynthesis protein [Alteribacter natronophilus]
MSERQLVRGTMILTASIFISKMLGLIYIFPFQAIVGLEGLALYTYGYVPYTVLLSLATIGIPLAVSKFVAKYNALGDYRTGQRLFQSGLVVMGATGFVAFLGLFLLAPFIAASILDTGDLQGNSVEDAVFTIRMVSVALLVVPVMSIIRGYFQGHQSMGPTAVSQVIEQIVRIIFILLLTYLIINVWNGELGTAIGFATFGAFVGALGGLAVLGVYFMKRRDNFQTQIEESTTDHQIPLSSMYKELLRYSIPISLVGLSIPLYQMVDLFTFNTALSAMYDADVVDRYFGAFAQAAHKLILIPVSVATAMSLAILPTVTSAFVNDEKDRLQRQITQTYQIILFLSVPAAVGLSVLAYPAYGALFGLGDLAIGGEILRHYAPVAVLFSVFAVTSSLLQGINKQKFAVIALFSGLVIKLAVNTLFIGWFEAAGAVYATGLGYLAAVTVNVWAIGRFAEYNYSYLLKRVLLIGAFATVMGLVVFAVNRTMQIFIPLETQGAAFIILPVAITAGIAVFGFLGIRSGLAGQILGHRFRFLKKKKRAAEEA